MIQHGLFWNYGGVGWLSTVFWTSLTFADPVAAACLFVWPRVGLALTCGIIGLDVLHNAIVFSDILIQPPERHLWTDMAFGLQLAFLLFVIATVRVAWSQAPKAALRRRKPRLMKALLYVVVGVTLLATGAFYLRASPWSSRGGAGFVALGLVCFFLAINAVRRNRRDGKGS